MDALQRFAFSEDEYLESSTQTLPRPQQHNYQNHRKHYVYPFIRKKRQRPTKNESHHWLKKKRGTTNIHYNPEAPPTPPSPTESNTPSLKEETMPRKLNFNQNLHHSTATPPATPISSSSQSPQKPQSATPLDVCTPSSASHDHNQPLPPYFNKINPNKIRQQQYNPLPNPNPRKGNGGTF